MGGNTYGSYTVCEMDWKRGTAEKMSKDCSQRSSTKNPGGSSKNQIVLSNALSSHNLCTQDQPCHC
jgi:hypothetical protein